MCTSKIRGIPCSPSHPGSIYPWFLGVLAGCQRYFNKVSPEPSSGTHKAMRKGSEQSMLLMHNNSLNPAVGLLLFCPVGRRGGDFAGECGSTLANRTWVGAMAWKDSWVLWLGRIPEKSSLLTPSFCLKLATRILNGMRKIKISNASDRVISWQRIQTRQRNLRDAKFNGLNV